MRLCGLIFFFFLSACAVPAQAGEASPRPGTAAPAKALTTAAATAAQNLQSPTTPIVAVSETPKSEIPNPQSTTTPTATLTVSPTVTPTSGPSPTPTATPLPPVLWSQWPVIPTVSERARQIYRQALAKGADPHSFSSIGDCQSEPAVFLGIYDTNRYWLTKETQYLQETIDYFKGVFGRQSLAVRDGLSAPGALDPLWAYKDKCNASESPVACDLRVHKPSIVFINLGTNWRADASVDAYEKYLRQIVDLVIETGALPVLSTKADNIEGGHRINQATARVAYDYGIPLWNLWLAVQDLDNHGLDPTRKDVYLSVEAWDRRSFTALRVLDRLRNVFKDITP